MPDKVCPLVLTGGKFDGMRKTVLGTPWSSEAFPEGFALTQLFGGAASDGDQPSFRDGWRASAASTREAEK